MPDLSGISRAHTWAPPSVSIDVSLASVHSLRVILTWPSTEPLPRVSAVPPALARAVGDAVPSARQCPRPWLALSVTLSRARAAGLHPSFQPRSNRSPPCGRCRVAASTVRTVRRARGASRSADGPPPWPDRRSKTVAQRPGCARPPSPHNFRATLDEMHARRTAADSPR